MLKIIAAAFYVCICISTTCSAQLSVNPGWQQRNGLTVTSSQKRTVAATKLRGFATLESVAADPRLAVDALKTKKAAARVALVESHAIDKTIQFTTTKIAEWRKKPSKQFFVPRVQNGLWPSSNLDSYTAITHVSFDISIQGQEVDKVIVLPFTICKQLGEHPVFQSKEIVMLYVGEIHEPQVTETQKHAHHQATAEAKSLAALSGRSLGKLAELTAQVEGRWGWQSQTYEAGPSDDSTVSPLIHFTPAEHEVFGTDPLNLSRTYSIELRFEIN